MTSKARELIVSHEKQLKELVQKFESLNKEIDSFFEEIGTTVENVSTFMGNADNFDDETWDQMEQQRSLLNERLNRELANIRNPKRLEEKYSERHAIAPHWLFVR